MSREQEKGNRPRTVRRLSLEDRIWLGFMRAIFAGGQHDISAAYELSNLAIGALRLRLLERKKKKR